MPVINKVKGKKGRGETRSTERTLAALVVELTVQGPAIKDIFACAKNVGS